MFNQVVFFLLASFSVVSCNEMDPHVYPTRGPYFEGWYMRIIDYSQNISVGWLFAKILPKPQEINFSNPCSDSNSCNYSHPLTFSSDIDANKPLVMSSLLFNPGSKNKLESNDGIFLVSEYKVTENGHKVTQNPDAATPPSFEAVVSNNISFVVRPGGTKFSVNIGNAIVKGETESPVPWGPHGEGPESWLEKIPFEVHWFVYSLRSTVKNYEYRNTKTGQIVKGGSDTGNYVAAHMEKNWGKSFPKAWVWAEGFDPAENVTFAVSSGVITELGIDLKAELSGYRNTKKGISCSFHPLNSVHTLTHDGCAGKATLHSKGIECSVTFEMAATKNTFSRCLPAPHVDGFSPGCVESYSAVVKITVFQRIGLTMKNTDFQIVKMSALEFGGEYMCNGKCP